MAVTIVDSYSETNDAPGAYLYVPGDVDILGQSFTGNGTNIYSAKFYCANVPTTGGSLFAEVYTHSGTFGSSSVGTGSPLATSDAFSASSLGSLSLIELFFTGSNRINLTNGTKYVIALNGLSVTGGGAAETHRDTTSPTHPGNLCYKIGGSWSPQSGQDLIFYVYGGTPLVTVTKTHTTDLLLRKKNTRTHSTDSFKKRRFTRTYTTDSYLLKHGIRTHTTDSLKRRKTLRTYTTDSLKRRRILKTHTTDILKKKKTFKTHTTDSLIRKVYYKMYTTDLLLRKRITQARPFFADARQITPIGFK